MKEQEPIKKGPRLDQILELSPKVVQDCKVLSVTTLPEFLSYLQIAPQAIAEHLNLTKENVESIWNIAPNYMAQEEIDAIKTFVPQPRATGALDPHPKLR